MSDLKKNPWDTYSPAPVNPTSAPTAKNPWDAYAAPADSASEDSASAETGRGGGLAPFLNQIITSTLGAPVDLVNLGLSKFGVPVSKEPFGGSESFENLFAKYGQMIKAPMVPRVGQEAKTISEYIGSGLG